MIILQRCCMCVSLCVFFQLFLYRTLFLDAIIIIENGILSAFSSATTEQNNDTDIETNDCIPLSICVPFCCCYYYFESCDMIHNVLRFMAIRKESFTVYPYQAINASFGVSNDAQRTVFFLSVCVCLCYHREPAKQLQYVASVGL